MPEPRTVLCFGEALWDVTPNGRLPGGAPMNVALRLDALGVDATLLTRVGDDDPGRELSGFMADRGLRVDHVQVDPDLPTGVVTVDTSDPHEARYDIATPVAWDRIDAQAFLDTGEAVDVLLFGSLASRDAVSEASLKRLLERASLSVLDLNLRPPFDSGDRILSLLERADWVKLNESELDVAAALGGIASDSDGLLEALASRFGLEVICVTKGGDGAAVFTDGRVFQQPAFAVDVVDTIGCGDAFLGSWLKGMLEGRDAAEVLTRASAVGALVAASAGANPEITESMIDALIAS